MSSFIKNIIKLSTGSVIAQLIGLFTMPIITRLFEPEALGILGIFTALTAITGVAANLRYEFAIMLPEKEEEARIIFSLSVFVALLFSLLVLIVIVSTKNNLLTLLKIQSLGNLIYYVPALTLFLGLFQALNRWYSRKKKFGFVARGMIIQRASAQGVMIGSGFLGFSSGGFLIAARVAGYAFSSIYLSILFLIHEKFTFGEKGHLRKIKMLAIRYKNFPKYDLWSALLNSGSQNLPLLLIGYYFTPQIVGYYALGRQVLSLPMLFIGQAIGQVFFQRATEAKHEGTITIIVESIFEKLVRYGILPFLILMFSGRELFSFIFGSQWSEAGIYVQYLSLWLFFVFLSSPLSTIFSVLEEQKIFLKWNISLFISRLSAIFVGGYYHNENLAILLLGIVGVINYIIVIIMILNLSKVKLKTLILLLTKIFFKSLPFVFLCYLLSKNNIKGLNLCIYLAIISIIYYLSQIYCDMKTNKI